MRVICINQDTKTVVGPTTPPLLIVGNIYVVIDTEVWKNKLWYTLNEMKYIQFNACLFATLDSDIDETELAEAREKEEVCNG